jgi:hypothetical protein
VNVLVTVHSKEYPSGIVKEPSSVIEMLELKKRAIRLLNATVIGVECLVLLIPQQLQLVGAVVLDYSVGSGTENDVSFDYLLGAMHQQQLAILQEVLEPI